MQFLLLVGATFGTQIPTGTVQMFDNGTKIGGHIPLQASGPLGSPGPFETGFSQAAFTTSLSAGPHHIEFTYSGDKTFLSIPSGDFNEGQFDFTVNAASGAGSVIQVQQNPLNVALTQTANYGVSVRSAVAGGPIPSGTVSLVGPNGIVFAGPVSLINGNATLPITFGVAGPFEIAASYSGDSHYSVSSSGILSTNVAKGIPTVTLTTPAPAIKQGLQTTFAVSLIGDPAIPQTSTPFGFVQFFDSLNGGAPVPLGPPQLLTVGNGNNPIFVLPAVLPVGSHVMKAEYLGSNDWATAFSNTVSVVVNP